MRRNPSAMTSRLARAVLAAAVLLPASSVTGAGAADRYETLEIVRVRRGTTRDLTITLDFNSIDPRGFAGLFGVVRKNGRNALGFAGTVEHGAPEPAVFGPGVPALPASPFRMTSGGRYATVVPGGTTMRLFVVSQQAAVDVELDSREWAVRRSRLTVRRLVEQDVSTGARTPVYGVEHFQGPVSLPGGRYGSVAWAGIPCARTPYPDPLVGAGAGSATLEGADAPEGLHCLRNSAMASHHARTVWTLTGSVRGLSDVHTRLFVLDFPQ